jgi:L-aminopeptidase/D-esterase-like protein
MGYRACLDACEDYGRQGNVGAGMGATVGMILGPSGCTKGGLGTACGELPGGLKIFALAVVNAFGDVVDESGEIIAGARGSDGSFLGTEAFLCGENEPRGTSFPGVNTTLGVVVCNARLSKADVNWVAQRGHNGLARALSPSHTKLDGDLVFAAATGEVEAAADLVGIAGATLLGRAVRNAVRAADSIAGIPASKDLV